VRWNVSVVVICISVVAREVEHFFLYILFICTSPFENFLFHSCACFKLLSMLVIIYKAACWGFSWVAWNL
jgi:hypothetical protein